MPPLFLLRVPPEMIQLRIDSGDDSISDFAPQKFKAIVGGRAIAEAPILLAKSPWRGNLRPGCILLRPCLRGDREEIARTLCPAHLAMPLITAGLSKSGPLSPSLTRPDPNRILKRNLAAYGPQGEGAPRPTVFAEGDA